MSLTRDEEDLDVGAMLGLSDRVAPGPPPGPTFSLRDATRVRRRDWVPIMVPLAAFAFVLLVVVLLFAVSPARLEVGRLPTLAGFGRAVGRSAGSHEGGLRMRPWDSLWRDEEREENPKVIRPLPPG